MKKSLRVILTAALVASAVQVIASSSSFAGAAAIAPVAAAAPGADARKPGGHQAKRLTPDKLPPVSPESRETVARFSAQATCTPADFSSRTGSALVAFVKASAVSECLYTLFNYTGSAAVGAFKESQVVTIATAYRDNTPSYPGTNATSTLQLVMFLRAAFYVQENNSGSIPSYTAAVTGPVQSGLDSFFASSRLLDVNDTHGEILAETVTLSDSAELQHRYLAAYKRILNGYNSSWNAFYWMRTAAFNVFLCTFRGNFYPAFVNAVIADPSIVDTMNAFAVNHSGLLGGEYGYLPAAAGSEMARFVQHDALKAKIRPLAKARLDSSSITGPTAKMWVGVAGMVDYYDGANCAYYNVCNLPSRLAAAALPVRHNCDPGHTIWAQQMSAAELAATCQSVQNQDSFFHNASGSNASTPVANDHNTNIRINVFDSDEDYQTYAGAIFGIDTNNGGMYLEGDPSVPGNQPNFVAYEATWLRPVFAIWNLNHEYTHYLDGRYNMYGDFEAGMSTPTVMWVEGFAEYISYHYRGEVYAAAIAEAGKRTFSLSTLFDTTYEPFDVNRIYRWGYLGVRYMLEKHRPDVMTLLGHYRSGNWAAARTLLKTTIGTRYDADFSTWLGTLSGTPGTCTAVTNSNDVTIADLSTVESGLTVANCAGNALSTSTVAVNIVHTYIGDLVVSLVAPDGSTYVLHNRTGGSTDNINQTYPVNLSSEAANGAWKLRVQDAAANDVGYINSWTLNTGSGGGGGVSECADPNLQALGKNCKRSNVSANAGGLAYFWIYLPAGVSTLSITSAGGTGNADLYYNADTWATSTAYTARSTNAGNGESLTINNPAAGYRYISLHAASAFSGVTVTTTY